MLPKTLFIAPIFHSEKNFTAIQIDHSSVGCPIRMKFHCAHAIGVQRNGRGGWCSDMPKVLPSAVKRGSAPCKGSMIAWPYLKKVFYIYSHHILYNTPHFSLFTLSPYSGNVPMLTIWATHACITHPYEIWRPWRWKFSFHRKVCVVYTLAAFFKTKFLDSQIFFLKL